MAPVPLPLSTTPSPVKTPPGMAGVRLIVAPGHRSPAKVNDASCVVPSSTFIVTSVNSEHELPARVPQPPNDIVSVNRNTTVPTPVTWI